MPETVMGITIPNLSLVLLIGHFGSGKSSVAARHSSAEPATVVGRLLRAGPAEQLQVEKLRCSISL